MSTAQGLGHQHPVLDEEQLWAQAPSDFVRPRGAVQAVWLLPQNLIIAGLKLYRMLISPLYGDV